MSRSRQLADPLLWSRAGRPGIGLAVPLAVVALACLGVVLVPPYLSDWWVYALAGLVLAVIAGLFVLSVRHPVRTWLDPAPAYLMFLFVGLVHHAAGGAAGGTSSGLGASVLLPVLWLAITGTRRELWVASGLTVLVSTVPIVLVPVVQRIVHDLDRETRRARTANERPQPPHGDAQHPPGRADLTAGRGCPAPPGTYLRVARSTSQTLDRSNTCRSHEPLASGKSRRQRGRANRDER